MHVPLHAADDGAVLVGTEIMSGPRPQQAGDLVQLIGGL